MFDSCNQNLIFPLSGLSLPCPESHPYAINSGNHCCADIVKSENNDSGECDGSFILFKSSLECCQNADYVPCQQEICSDRSKGKGRKNCFSCQDNEHLTSVHFTPMNCPVKADFKLCTLICYGF